MKCQICEKIIKKGNLCYICKSGEEFKKIPISKFLQDCGVWKRSAIETEKIYPSENIKEIFQFGKSYYFHGETGTGKTISACEILYLNSINYHSNEKVFNRLSKACFITTPALLFEIKKTYNLDRKNSLELTEDDIVRAYQNADVLVLDDFGVEKMTDWVLSILYLIISYRYENYKTTIFTSNYDLNDLMNRMNDGRIPSRIGGWCEAIKFDGKDLRQT